MNTLSKALLPLLRESVSKYRGVMSGLAFELDRILIWFGLRVHIVLLTHDIFKYRHMDVSITFGLSNTFFIWIFNCRSL